MDADCGFGQHDVPLTEASVGAEQVRGADGVVVEYVAFKVVTGNAAERKDAKPTPSAEIQAMELAAKEF